MKVIIKAKTRAKIVGIKRIGQPSLDLGLNKEKEKGKEEIAVYQVAVKEAPVGGKANEAIVKALAEYFETSTSHINLISGMTSKQKIFEIL